MFCKNCGKEIGEGSDYCKFCGGRQTQAKESGQQEFKFPISWADSKGAIIAATGAIFMLISLSLTWYQVMGSRGYSRGISFDDLSGSGQPMNFVWAGSGLPLILVIVCASFILVSVACALLFNAKVADICRKLAGTSIFFLLVNLAYVLLDIKIRVHGNYYAVPHIGWFFALAGAIVVIAGNAKIKRGP